MKIIEYRTVACSYSKLADLVNKCIAEGWEPIGGAVSNQAEYTNQWIQTMVKYDRSQEDLMFEQINDMHSAMVGLLPHFIQNWNDHMRHPRSVTISKG